MAIIIDSSYDMDNIKDTQDLVQKISFKTQDDIFYCFFPLLTAKNTIPFKPVKYFHLTWVEEDVNGNERSYYRKIIEVNPKEFPDEYARLQRLNDTSDGSPYLRYATVVATFAVTRGSDGRITPLVYNGCKVLVLTPRKFNDLKRIKDNLDENLFKGVDLLITTNNPKFQDMNFTSKTKNTLLKTMGDGGVIKNQEQLDSIEKDAHEVWVECEKAVADYLSIGNLRVLLDKVEGIRSGGNLVVEDKKVTKEDDFHPIDSDEDDEIQF